MLFYLDFAAFVIFVDRFNNRVSDLAVLITGPTKRFSWEFCIKFASKRLYLPCSGNATQIALSATLMG